MPSPRACSSLPRSRACPPALRANCKGLPCCGWSPATRRALAATCRRRGRHMESESTVRVLVVDDHQVLADSLVRLWTPSLTSSRSMSPPPWPGRWRWWPSTGPTSSARPRAPRRRGPGRAPAARRASGPVCRDADREHVRPGARRGDGGRRRRIHLQVQRPRRARERRSLAARSDAVVRPRAARPAAQPDATRGADRRAPPAPPGAGAGDPRCCSRKRTAPTSPSPSSCSYMSTPCATTSPTCRGSFGVHSKLEALLAIAVREGLVGAAG